MKFKYTENEKRRIGKKKSFATVATVDLLMKFKGTKKDEKKNWQEKE